uniref:Amino acid transporter n=1 Tax=Chelonoidis abingdonii TaxID=106734 RepID=A0A8C0IT13_CHEAB
MVELNELKWIGVQDLGRWQAPCRTHDQRGLCWGKQHMELVTRAVSARDMSFAVQFLMSGLATMDSKACGKMGLITLTYYLWTTFMAVTVGIVLVINIHPGAAAQKEEYTTGKVVLSSADALLDLIRNMFPSNLIEASFQQYRTVLVPVVKSSGFPKIPGKPLSFIYFAPDDENSEIQRPVLLEITPSPEMTYRTLPGTSNEMNVLGIVIFSATIGLLLGKMGERGTPLVNVCQCLNEAVMKIVSMAVWYFPFGIVFLIAGKILEMEDPAVIGKKLGLYAITVVTGLVIHGLILLPLLFTLITRKNPFAFIRGILQALLIALATSSRYDKVVWSSFVTDIPLFQLREKLVSLFRSRCCGLSISALTGLCKYFFSISYVVVFSVQDSDP